MRKVKKTFSLKSAFFLLLFWCSKPKKSIIDYSKHSEIYIFLKAETLSYLLKAFSWALL